ncbi:hypothetical protein [Faecalitalea cylindroides]|uniref:hypothetical protein n=1 Tax=Faecalitalea cylindroides TaxID=39483 RepID=UPI00232EFBB8|nr:hypothetical protein [Faecalitalea cylindroides]MDB7952983.1 hypothetical protein [Faecalitalea cylindroides]MDB7959901.1 hypothetical protein [Faecalitalea cylindroides]MDB7961597.1 hypothetical protein [Faecalitalea cylindroides]MDB7963559.1 hypothetical protein [Faecalitalea cylindroides]MDB7965479.1 hypothetical protein [Faecalitalea cylindroides]
MNKITIKNGNNKYDITINRVKYVFSSNQDEFKIKQSFRNYFSKNKSEFRKENGNSNKVLFNDKDLDVKRTLFVEINSDFSINEDCKLNSKSLILKYLELRLQDMEYFDTINTINLLFESLSEELKDENGLNTLFDAMDYKHLSKLINPYYFDELQKDEYDLTFEELLLFQIKLIKYISLNNNFYEYIIVFIDLDEVTQNLIQQINSLLNCYVICFSKNYVLEMSDDAAIIENEVFDLSNIEEVYAYFYQKSSNILPIEEVRLYMKQYIIDKYTYKKIDIIDELIKYGSK